MFGYRRKPKTDRDPVVRLWTEITGRSLSPRERSLFLRRTETEVLRGLLMLHGAEWMTATAKRSLRPGRDRDPQLRLRDWVTECHRVEEAAAKPGA
jgi:hypothetical protein